MEIIKRLGRTGDTMVEVLIAIAVTSVIIGGAYVSSNESLSTTRRSQERVEALKVAETQLERVITDINDPSSTDTFDAANYFCMDSSVNVRPSGSSPKDLATYPPHCQIKPPQDGVTYYASIERVPPSPPSTSGDIFTVSIYWNRLGGSAAGELEEVRLMYRAHQ